jgi:hypothetical protein
MPFAKGRHGVASVFIGLEIAPTLFEARWYEPIFDAGRQNAIRAAIGAAGGDALTNIVDLEAKGSTKLMKCYFLGGLRK